MKQDVCWGKPIQATASRASCPDGIGPAYQGQGWTGCVKLVLWKAADYCNLMKCVSWITCHCFISLCNFLYCCIFCIILLYVAQSAAPWTWKQTLLQAGVWRDFHAGPRNAVDGNHKTKWWVSSEPNVTLVGCSALVCAFAVNRSDMISYSQFYTCSISCSACSGDCCAIETDKCEL